MYLFDSFIAGWLSDSFHKCLLNTYYVPGSVLHIPVRINGLLPHNLFTHHQRKQTSLLQMHPDTILWKVQSSVFLLGNNYHAEVKIILKALLCVCKHTAAHHMIAFGSEHSERKL